MKYYVINRGDELSLKLADTFHQLAEKHNLVPDPSSPDIVLSIGGDGTMLQAFHLFVQQLENTSFVGIHTGHLGFYADWKPEEIEQLVELMAKPPQKPAVEYPVAELIITTQNETQTFLALNEFTIKGIGGTLVAKLHMNNHMFEMFRGDGICISTPSGSTGYNKSLGGALIPPSLETIQITEIASINNRVYRTIGSSMILPKHHHCDIYPISQQKLLLTVDHLQFEYDDIISIRSQVASKKVRFVRYRPFPFWHRVREAFISDDFSEA